MASLSLTRQILIIIIIKYKISIEPYIIKKNTFLHAGVLCVCVYVCVCLSVCMSLFIVISPLHTNMPTDTHTHTDVCVCVCMYLYMFSCVKIHRLVLPANMHCCLSFVEQYWSDSSSCRRVWFISTVSAKGLRVEHWVSNFVNIIPKRTRSFIVIPAEIQSAIYPLKWNHKCIIS